MSKMEILLKKSYKVKPEKKRNLIQLGGEVVGGACAAEGVSAT